MVVGPGVLYMHGQGRAGQPVPGLSPYPPAFHVSKPGHAPLGCLTFVCPLGEAPTEVGCREGRSFPREATAEGQVGGRRGLGAGALGLEDRRGKNPYWTLTPRSTILLPPPRACPLPCLGLNFLPPKWIWKIPTLRLRCESALLVLWMVSGQRSRSLTQQPHAKSPRWGQQGENKTSSPA